MSADSGLVVERRDQGVVGLWLDRPAKRNALDRPLVNALSEAFRDEGARAFVLGSSSGGAFSGGADLSLDDSERAEVSDLLYDLYGTMLATPAPIVAAVEGPAVGGGAQLALASDIRIGSAGARLRFLGPGHGLAIGAWGLPSLVGRGRALDICLTMRALDAAEAHALGLLDRLAENAREDALEFASELAQLDAAAVARIKSIVRTASGVVEALAEEREGNRASWTGSVAGL
jgi:enoyl-CoA hydratase/carnithine racemase